MRQKKGGGSTAPPAGRRALVFESTSTEHALVLALHVRSEGAPLSCGKPTPRNVAGEALPRVSAHVTSESATIRCSIPTPSHLTGKGALLRVNAHVTLEMATP